MRRALALGAIAAFVLSAGGALTLPFISHYLLWYGSVFYGQFAAIEPWWLAASALFALLLIASLRGRDSASEHEWPQSLKRRSTAAPWIIAAFVFLTAALGTYLVFHGFYFADDEYSAWFQAVIFAKGKSTATLGPQWCTWIQPLVPTSVATSGCTWHLSFLPIHSLVRAAFIRFGIDHLAGPATAAASVLLIAAIARKLWPARPERAVIAAVIFGASTQVLFMSMTMYAMPTHLLFALVWLWLYVDDKKWSVALLPWVGIAALGVHSPYPHGMWVMGFLLRYPVERRWGVTLYLATVYSLGLMFWAGWLGIGGAPAGAALSGTVAIAPASATASTIINTFHAPTLLQRLTTLMHLALLQTWSTPIAIALAVAAMTLWPRLEPVLRYTAVSLIIMLVARLLQPENQGEGWGYRYAYTGLGNIALLAAVGADALIETVGRRRAVGLLGGSLAFSLFVQLPIRGVQVEHIVRPYWQAYEFMAHQDADVVVYPWHAVMWGRQLVRNDPFMRNRPKIMGFYELRNSMDTLARTFPGRIRVIGGDELKRFGLPMEPSVDSLKKLLEAEQ